MDALKEMLRKADDDYLIGLSNKGTVKRAYKDLALEAPAVTWKGEEAEVALKEETCVIRTPLGESSCSCPSRSICRHTITAILWLKQNLPEEGDAEEETGQKDSTAKEGAKEDVAGGPGALTEVLELPAERLKKACKGRRYQQFLAHVRMGELPKIEESSIVTVPLPWENATVKLLEPFVYSTCTCHSKELCAHKAQAVLLYQLSKGRLQMKDLETSSEAEKVLEKEKVQKACESVRESVAHQIGTGLSRQSPEISDSLERLAIITHRAGLASLEGRLREAASEYRQYFSRSAVFDSEALFRRLLSIYQRSKVLSTSEDQEQIRKLAGTFRDAYEPVGKLHLVGMGGRTFASNTGYEGEIYYFLEPDRGQWYTWTDARPVFYEGTRRRPPSSSGNGAAPWGLSCNREQLQNVEFELMNAKAASGGRLSVSKDSVGEILGNRSLLMEGIKEQIFWDYKELLFQNFANGAGEEAVLQNRAFGRKERLALAGALDWGQTVFDPVEQRFSWCLYDREGRPLFLSLKYKKEEKLTIQLLERLEQRLKKRPRKAIVFLGALYLDERGRLCLYPIEFFLDEAEAAAEILCETPKEGSRTDSGLPSREVLMTMEQYLGEVIRQLSDLFVSGLYSLQEDTAEQIAMLSEDGERLGMHQAGRELAAISSFLKEKRHRMEYSMEPVLEAAERLHRYLEACREKISCDLAAWSMGRGKEEEQEKGE